MKRHLLLLVAIAFAGVVIGQPVLSYENHRLLPGMDNPMTLCEFKEPGQGGAEKVWDFSDIKPANEFVGQIVNSYSEDEFERANTKLREFKTSFYFDINESGIYQVGYSSNDGKTQVKYLQPFEKLKFPFTFEDSYITSFSGEYLYNSNKLGDIVGNGEVEADAWGELILPNNKVYQNTVRVKTVKNYTISYSATNSSSVEILTYRWYNSSHRYPLLVFTEYRTISGNNERTNYQAAYNNNAVGSPSVISELALDENINIYPNPSTDRLFVDITAEIEQAVFFSIVDITGKMVVNEYKVQLTTGANTIDLSDELQSLYAGTYFLRIRKGEQIVNKELAVSNK